MGCIGIDICDSVVSLIKSDEVQAILKPLYNNEDFDVERSLVFDDDSADIERLKIRVTPGQITNLKNLRVKSEYDYIVGVSLRDRIYEPETDVAKLGAFADRLFLILQKSRHVVEGVTGLELRNIESPSLYNVSSLEGVACYDSLILLDFGYFR